ncbi:hypothetical protein BD770DRAFT_415570 [Pilaira anomala]|nr:hypothetical protein BD770DRAFT_415570 [Pilaira anomala]
MNYFPSPPNSPYLYSQQDHVICGDCNKSLGSDWFCSDCHKKCNTCNRFLGQDEYCTRCWSFDPVNQQFCRKLNKYHSSYTDYLNTSDFSGLPTPSNSTASTTTNASSSNEPKLLTRPFTYL